MYMKIVECRIYVYVYLYCRV